MSVALVHDDLVQFGGAERVLLAFSEVFPNAPIYTSLIDYSNPAINENFKDKKVITSFMQKIPFSKKLFKALLPLYPLAYEQFDFSGFDLVISQTTRFAKAIITKPETIHLSYINTPPRFLWKFSNERVPGFLSPLLSYLRFYDQISAKRVDYFIANSFNVQKRIKKVYKSESFVLQAFVDFDKFAKAKTTDGDYYVIIARLNKYKRTDLAVEALTRLGKNLVVIGNGPELENLKRRAGEGVKFVGAVSDKEKIEILSGCKALILAAEEDFGITPLEAQAVGKPVIAYKAGGALETVIEGKTGLFFDSQTVDSLIKAILDLEKLKIDPKLCKDNAEKYSRENFKKRFLEIIDEIKAKGV